MPAEASTKSHSKILGSKAAYAYPRLIAVCCVLHRSLESSYPPVGFLLKPFLCSNKPYLFAFAGLIDQNDHDSLLQLLICICIKRCSNIFIVFNPYTTKHLVMRILIYTIIYPWIFHCFRSIRVQITW